MLIPLVILIFLEVILIVLLLLLIPEVCGHSEQKALLACKANVSIKWIQTFLMACSYILGKSLQFTAGLL